MKIKFEVEFEVELKEQDEKDIEKYGKEEFRIVNENKLMELCKEHIDEDIKINKLNGKVVE